MTIAIAWVRRIADCEELIFASDSRLSGDGINFDCCPKVSTLPRTDCAIAFAGYTGHAYPMMSQIALAIDAHAPAKRGSLDIAPLRKHALKIFDGMGSYLNASPSLRGAIEANPDASFLFGGYSWIQKRFRLWSFSYEPLRGSFVGHPAQWIGLARSHDAIVLRTRRTRLRGHTIGPIAITGDQAHIAKRLIVDKLERSDAFPASLNMEPLEVIRDMLRDPNHAETIGGAPQIVKVYQYMKSATLGVYWPTKSSGTPTLRGRPCLPYERIDNWILDPDSLHSDQQGSEAKSALKDEA